MHPVIRQIVDRQHVSTPYRKVVKEVISKLKGGWPTFKGLPRKARRDLITLACFRHYVNRDLYVEVTSGNLFKGREN